MSSDTRPEWTHYHAAFIYKKHKNVFIFSIISEYFDGTCSWNPSWGKTGSQGISSHGIDLIVLAYSSISTRRINRLSGFVVPLSTGPITVFTMSQWEETLHMLGALSLDKTLFFMLKHKWLEHL